MAANDEILYASLVRMGVMPSVAERIIADANAAGQALPTAADAEQDAEITEADKETAAQWWLYTPDVPRRFKRLLHAKANGQ